MILGAGLLLGFEIYLQSYRLLFSALDLMMIGPQAAVAILAAGLMAVSLIRNRLGAIELSVSQSALFGSVVLLLIGGYLVIVGVLGQLWTLIGTDTAELWQGLLLLLSLIGLISLMLSARLKATIKQWLAQHFYAHQYDYRREWLQLTERASRQFGLDASLRVVVERLSELFGAPRVSAWLFDETGQQLRLAVTVQVSSTQESAWRSQPIIAPALAASLLSWDGPRSVASLPAGEIDPVTTELRTFVQQTQAHVAAPLVLGGRALGLLAIGSRVTGQPYGPEELLLLGAIAQQSAASVLTARLAQEVMRTREAELSQLYSTFLVHDLKNLGTTLSLVAQNLPVRHADARFRDDAQRVINDTIDKIKEMTERVATLRQDYELVLESTDLNRVAEESLRSLNSSMAPAVTFEPTPLPPVRLDRRQFRSVLTNLLLNAGEASRQSGGGIRLRTECKNGWASLSVIDDGCGMSAEFMDRHLFRPFHSTKPGGLGIGLYQCRKIVDAHGGRMTVNSQEGKGTTVTILVPTLTESSPC
jgi:putative PEP-CTERM system histidine kinase